MTTITATLPRRGGTITISQNPRPAGIVAYELAGHRLRATVVIEPYVRDDQPIPDRYAMLLGDGSRIQQRRTGLPVVHGVTICGSAGPIDLTHPQWPSQLRLARIEHAGGTRPGKVTEAPRRYLVEALTAVATQHLLLDQDALMMAAARATAHARLRRCAHAILPAHRMLRETQEQLAAAYALADQLQALSPLAVTASGTRRCRGWHPCLDPDSYLTAADDGDWLTCSSCQRVTTMLDADDRLESLVAAHTAHRCE